MRCVHRGVFGRGENPYFPVCHVLAASKTVNFRDGFRVEPVPILAHRGTRSRMVSGRASVNLR